MPSQTTENYLKAIYMLSRRQQETSLSELSQEMDVSSPTANSMVKKLREKGWLIYEKYKPLRLTEEGKKMAALVIRKHRITEMFLVEKMGFGWEEVHDIAEEIEHVQSEVLFERMYEMLGRPATDPHGSPIPDKSGHTNWPAYLRLSEAEAGRKYTVRAIDRSPTELLLYLNRKEISLGTSLEVTKKEPFDNSLMVSYKNFHSVSLSKAVCDQLLVEETH